MWDGLKNRILSIILQVKLLLALDMNTLEVFRERATTYSPVSVCVFFLSRNCTCDSFVLLGKKDNSQLSKSLCRFAVG